MNDDARLTLIPSCSPLQLGVRNYPIIHPIAVDRASTCCIAFEAFIWVIPDVATTEHD
jgi:hypothetical protein